MRQYNGNGILHGALTNGHAWVFIIVVLNPDGNGAKYHHSVPIAFQSNNPPQILKLWPDVLASIIFHWVSLWTEFSYHVDTGAVQIENSLEDLGSDTGLRAPRSKECSQNE